MNLKEKNLLVAVGSRSDEVCSIGSFARAEAEHLRASFKSVQVLEPVVGCSYPQFPDSIAIPDFILFHAPALHDRKKPWNAIASVLKLRRRFPDAKLITVVHEYSEAPKHWKIRQRLLNYFSDGVVTNSKADFEGVLGRSQKQRKVIRTNLGPTLYDEELLEQATPPIIEARRKALRQELSAVFDLKSDGFWILHPGLVTPGKGVDALLDFKTAMSEKDTLIVMGGLGPKARDQEFANSVVSSLQENFKNRFRFLESLPDSTFKKMLLAADLVLLPYNEGVSERRSSFLSALSCGANVWTTLGKYSPELRLETAGVHYVLASTEEANQAQNIWANSVRLALSEASESQTQRRVYNLEWAKTRAWNKRTENLQDFFHSLSEKP